MVVEPVHPSRPPRLHVVDRPDVVRRAVVVPSEDLDERDVVPVLDEKVPALSQQPVVAAVDEVLARIVLQTRTR